MSGWRRSSHPVDLTRAPRPPPLYKHPDVLRDCWCIYIYITRTFQQVTTCDFKVYKSLQERPLGRCWYIYIYILNKIVLFFTRVGQNYGSFSDHKVHRTPVTAPTVTPVTAVTADG